MADYKSYVTNKGNSKIAKAVTDGTAIGVVELAIGDGGGSAVSPSPDMTSLVHEVARVSVTGYDEDVNANTITITANIPADMGGFTIRELGVYDNTGDLIAVCNYPNTVKPVLADGIATDLVVGMTIAVSSLDGVTLAVDPSKVLATRDYADKVITDHTGKSDPHAQYLKEADYVEDFAHLHSVAGYQKLPSGLIIQWGSGSIAAGESSQDIVFPITFPHRAYSWSVCKYGLASTSNLESSFTIGSLSASGGRVSTGVNSGSTPQAIRWLVIGH